MSFIFSILPDIVDLFIVFPLAIAYATGAAWIASKVKAGFGLKTNYSRKIFHFLVFTMAFTLGIVFPIHRVAAFGAGAACVTLGLVMFKERVPLVMRLYNALAREKDAPNRSYFLIVPLIATALGGLTTGFLFPGFSTVGYLVAGWGDAIGEPAGVRFGRYKYAVPTLSKTKCYRSFEGSLAVYIMSFIAALAVLLLLGYGTLSFSLALGAALLAVLVEAFSPHGWDNFTVQLAACTGVFLMLTVVGW